MFSNKVDLMETSISWVVCRTLIFNRWYNDKIVNRYGQIRLPCVQYVESVEYSFLIYYSVNLRSDVYFFRLVAQLFSALSAVCLFRLGWIRAFVCLAFVWRFTFIRIWCLSGDACLLSGNPKMRNSEPEKTDENQNPESTNQRKQVLQLRESLLGRIFAF